MNVDHRLHHAARELREVHIETPPLVGPPPVSGHRTSGRIAATVAPILFAIGGLVMVAGGLRSESASRPESLPVPATIAPAPVGSAATVTTSPIEELRLITSLVAHVEPPAPRPADPARPRPIGVV